jgi:hypothetical protein
MVGKEMGLVVQTRADKIIEGFKLGSLGAGKKFVGEKPELAPVYRRNVNGRLDVIYKAHPNEDHPYIKWMDTDGIVYILACDQVSEKKWKVQLYTQKSRVASSPSDEYWVLSTEVLTEKQARKLYAKGFGMVVPEGIYTILKSGYLNSFYVTKSQDEYSNGLELNLRSWQTNDTSKPISRRL